MSLFDRRRTVVAVLAVPSILMCAGTASSNPPATTPATPTTSHDSPASTHDDPHAAPAKKPASKGTPASKTETGHDDDSHGSAKKPVKPESKGHASNSHADEHADGHETPAKNVKETAKSAPTEIKTTSAKMAASTAADEPVTAEMALKMLQDGNARWVSNAAESPNTDSARRTMVANKGQKPFVTVLTCADSRLPVERVFDRGVGEVFVVRVAGNVAGTSETGTIEYGVGHLKTPLLVVMGHTKCGAVAAAASKAELHGSLGQLVSQIGPAVDRAKRNNPEADDAQIASIAIRENVWQSIFDLYKYSPELTAAASKGELKVVGAICDITTGKVEFLGEHPWQQELVNALNSRNAPKTADAEPHSDH